MWVRKTVPFAGTCAARSEVTLVSKRIRRPFRTAVIHTHFPTGAENLLLLDFWESPDDQAPATGDPTGVNLLADYGQAEAIRGDGVSIILHHVIGVFAGGAFLKVHATNNDFYDHAVDVQIEIDVEEGEKD